MPDPWGDLRSRGFSPYGPEGEIFQMNGFANGVRRASGWRRVVGVGIAGADPGIVPRLGLVSIVQLAGGGHSQVQTSVRCAPAS